MCKLLIAVGPLAEECRFAVPAREDRTVDLPLERRKPVKAEPILPQSGLAGLPGSTMFRAGVHRAGSPQPYRR
jgi:hypothetical protein